MCVYVHVFFAGHKPRRSGSIRVKKSEIAPRAQHHHRINTEEGFTRIRGTELEHQICSVEAHREEVNVPVGSRTESMQESGDRTNSLGGQGGKRGEKGGQSEESTTAGLHCRKGVLKTPTQEN